MIKLVCKEVIFYSQNDELNFFNWISKIKSISKWEGLGWEIDLYLPRRRISDKSLRDLIALFYRYKIDMIQLQQFMNSRNEKWFLDKKSFWHKKVFGNN
jgi:hypothetical protein